MIMENYDIGLFNVGCFRWMNRTLQFVDTNFEWVPIPFISAYCAFEQRKTKGEKKVTTYDYYNNENINIKSRNDFLRSAG